MLPTAEELRAAREAVRPSGKLALFLRAAREEKSLALRAVERATGISNAYLSQLEWGKIRQPSPVILYRLAELYQVPYETMMEQAGYPAPRAAPAVGRTVIDSPVGLITAEEEQALLDYLDFLRFRRVRDGMKT
jgi:transcriptional regulator with XRE-family HTH domain